MKELTFAVGDRVILKSTGWSGVIEKVNPNQYGEGYRGYYVFFSVSNTADWFSWGSLEKAKGRAKNAKR